MYHPGQVRTIIKRNENNTDTHATLLMWDGLMFTFKVSSSIEDKIKKGDIVLVDYNPISTPPHTPKWTVCKILKGDEAKRVMAEYKGYYKRQKKEKRTMQAPQYTPPPLPPTTIPGVG